MTLTEEIKKQLDKKRSKQEAYYFLFNKYFLPKVQHLKSECTDIIEFYWKTRQEKREKLQEVRLKIKSQEKLEQKKEIEKMRLDFEKEKLALKKAKLEVLRLKELKKENTEREKLEFQKERKLEREKLEREKLEFLKERKLEKEKLEREKLKFQLIKKQERDKKLQKAEKDKLQKSEHKKEINSRTGWKRTHCNRCIDAIPLDKHLDKQLAERLNLKPRYNKWVDGFKTDTLLDICHWCVDGYAPLHSKKFVKKQEKEQ